MAEQSAHPPLILALDQGTTSSRAILFDLKGNLLDQVGEEHHQYYPADGWVEHDAEEIWATVRRLCAALLGRPEGAHVAALGITNQRETTVIWDRATGRPVYNAIVWQDRRTADLCARLKADGHEPMVKEKTGLLLDPYFSATKIAWILDNVEDVRRRAEQGELAFGTMDSWLVWNLTGSKRHVTDITNAARTLLFNIAACEWDDDILQLLDIPRALLPDVLPCAADFGTTDEAICGRAVPITGIAGDQQAATVGQTCFKPGMLKATYGTGCFAVLNTGGELVQSTKGLLATIAYEVGSDVIYAQEGSIFVAGAVVRWLRDALGLIADPAETAKLAASASSASDIYMVPAFTGLGAPYWDPAARGAIYGMTLETGRAELVKACLDSVCFQTRDLLSAMSADLPLGMLRLRVDGGMVKNDWFLQRLADLLGVPVERPKVVETTALGAAYLAGLGRGLYDSLDDLAANWSLDRAFEPKLSQAERDRLYAGWGQAVRRTLSKAGG